MNCPRCNVELSFKKKRCDNCGQDLHDYRRILSMSNACYNQGLQQAQVRDLSGAILSLRKSLKFYKKNTSARNLLGLIYFEEGEVVSALSEWVISKHFQEENNEADYYISQIQANPNKLESYNQMVKKYNMALTAAKNGDSDMAVIQLKKVVNMNPKYIRANQLLALLYMMTGKKENRIKAYKLMNSVIKVDVTNTTTLSYLKELSDIQLKREPDRDKALEPKRDPGVRKVLPAVDNMAYKPIQLYKEPKPSVMPFVYAIIGVVIGIVVTFFLIRPELIKKYSTDANSNFKNYSEQKIANDSDASTLKTENEKLTSQVDKLQKQVEELQGGSPTDIATLQTMYEAVIVAQQYFNDGDNLNAAKSLEEVQEDSLSSTAAKKLYKKIKKATFSAASDDFFTKGRDCYNGEGDYAGKQNYDKAIKLLEQALTYNADNTDAIYFLGRCYQQKGETEKAQEYYNKVVNDYPDSSRLSEAKSRLREMGQ